MRARIALRKRGKPFNNDDVEAETQMILKNQGLEVNADDVVLAMSRGEEVHKIQIISNSHC
jgi:hypothetical protein